MSLTKVSYSMINGAPYNVLDFGADPTGIDDSTTAIQDAMANGGSVYFPSGTYKVSTVVVEDVANLCIDASEASFTSDYGNLFYFNNCDDFIWRGGVINSGVGVNPAYNTPGQPTVVPTNFMVYGGNRAQISNLTCVNDADNSGPCITAWNMGQTQINNNQLYYGGDNSIWVFASFHVTASNNLMLNQERGRGICYQQVNQGAIVGNVCAEGKGDGICVHGSANISITGNSVYNMDVDTEVLQLATGVSIEWDENATPTTVAAAVADPQLYNGVFCRNIVVSGNTISGIDGGGVRIGNNSGISGSNYGNQGQVIIDANNIFGVSYGINCGTSRQIRISNNMISTSNTSCVEIKMGTDTGGYSAQDIYVSNNRLTNFNISLLGYQAVQFADSGSYTASRRFVLTDNQFDSGNGSAGFCNLSATVIGVNSRNNSYAAGTTTPILSNQVAPFEYQSPFSDQTGANALAGMFVSGASTEFTQTGQVGDSFTTVFTMPADTSIAAQIQIGIGDRIVCFGTIYANNGTPPALTFTGTGASYVQLSGANLQIQGYTSGGTAPYGGYYSIKYSLLKP